MKSIWKTILMTPAFVAVLTPAIEYLSTKQAYAATDTKYYVTDVLFLPIRSGPGPDHKIIRNLKSGQIVTLSASEPPQNGYLFVKTADIEGWVPDRYLVDKPVAGELLAEAQKQAESATAKAEELRIQNDQLKKDQSKLTQELASLKALQTNLSKDLSTLKETSGGVIELASEKAALSANLETLKAENEALKLSNEKLSKDSHNEGIKLGIMAVIFGLILGVIFPYLKPHKKRTPTLKLR